MFGICNRLRNIERKQDAILQNQSDIIEQQHLILKLISIMNTALQNLQNEVGNNTDLQQSAISLIQGLAQQIKDNADDPVAIKALADQIHSNSAALAAAIAANTPAAPPANS